MTQDKRLGDYVRVQTVEDVQLTLNSMENLFLSVRGWMETNRPRDAKRVILQNLLSASAQYLHVASDNLGTHVSVLALATRSLYELNVRTRSILSLADQLDNWQSEAVTDTIQIYEGILDLQTTNETSSERAILQTEIDRLQSLPQKYGLATIKKPASTGALASAVGRDNEHKGLFKLFSKLVHPSSYLTNDYNGAASRQVRMILEMHTQLYAWDTFFIICDAQSVPEELRSISVAHNSR